MFDYNWSAIGNETGASFETKSTVETKNVTKTCKTRRETEEVLLGRVGLPEARQRHQAMVVDRRDKQRTEHKKSVD